MKYLIIIATFLCTHTLTFGQECKKLDDGRYLFKHKKPKTLRLIISIKGNSYFIEKDGQESSKGKIEWWDDNCMFKLISDEAEEVEKTESLKEPSMTDSIKVLLPNTDPATLLQNTYLSYGGYCYERIGRRNSD